ncbi:MAG: HlyD family efflux transporter periplasmic adaptor subunit [Candidatus Gracilibacteria bacterium]|nr:HlyD family efflux transporter periplasmic adaptor subunit [Candidatus Gracilibacteria bacterium]
MSLINEIKTNSKKTTIKKIIIISILIGCSGFGYNYFSNFKKIEEIKTENKIYSVSKGNIKTSIEADGKVVLKDELNLDFINEGIIKNIYKNQGDLVKAGDKIASLDSSYLDLSIDKSKIALDIAKLNYEIKKKGVSNTELDISQKQLDKDFISMDSSIKEIDNSLEETKYNLETAKKNLENTKKQTQIDEIGAKNTFDNAKIDYDNSISNLNLTKKQEEEKYKNIANKLIMETGQMISNNEKYLYDLDILLGISDANKYQNDSYEIYLGAKNNSLKTLSENTYRETKSLFDDFYISWQEYRKNIDSITNLNYDELSNYSYKMKDISSNLNKTLSYTIDLLKNSISSSNFAQTTIDSYITNFENSLSNSKNDTANYMILLQTVSEAKTSMDIKIDSAEKLVLTSSGKLNTANSSLEKVKLQNEISIDNSLEKLNSLNLDIKALEIKKLNSKALANSQVDISKATLENKKNVDNLDIEPFYMAILQAQKTLDEAIKKKQDSILFSPIDGKIAQINGKISENTNSIKDPFVVIINNNNFYVDAYVEEGDITKIKNNQNVYISFDAIDTLTLTGNVVYIEDKANIDNNGLVSYRVEIIFGNNDDRIKDAMTSTVEFVTKEMKDVLIIPVQAVKNISGKPSVILENKEIRKVTTGFTDGKMVEVLSGLEKGEKIIY